MPLRPRTFRAALATAAALAVLAPAASASPESGLARSLSRSMASAGGASGAYVVDAQTGRRLFAWNAGTRRILASNTKLFTLGAALDSWGVDGTVPTKVLAGASLDDVSGIVDGDIWLRGYGDPSFGTSGADRLARQLYADGLRLVRGAVIGDESRFDSRRGGPAEGYAASGEVGGPLSALAFNHGLMTNGRFQTDPPLYAAARLTDALRRAGVKVEKPARTGTTPDKSVELARAESPPMSRLAQLTALPSDNYYAELLAKGLPGAGTTARGSRLIVRFARSRDARIRLADGSGLSRSNQAAPQQVVRYLVKERSEPEYGALYRALPTAGVNGTLFDRMRSGPAHHRCHAKTGTLNGVSALSGWCRSRGGHTLAFSILMNRVSSIYSAHRWQDRMAQSIAGYTGKG